MNKISIGGRLKVGLGYIVSIPVLTFIFFKVFGWLQKLLYQNAEEILFANGFLILYSLILSIFIPGFLVLTFAKLFLEYGKRLIAKSIFGPKGARFYYKLCIIVIIFSLLMTTLILHSYVKVTETKLIISTPSLTFNEKNWDYSDIESIDEFFIKFKDGTEISIKNILNNKELARVIKGKIMK